MKRDTKWENAMKEWQKQNPTEFQGVVYHYNSLWCGNPGNEEIFAIVPPRKEILVEKLRDFLFMETKETIGFNIGRTSLVDGDIPNRKLGKVQAVKNMSRVEFDVKSTTTFDDREMRISQIKAVGKSDKGVFEIVLRFCLSEKSHSVRLDKCRFYKTEVK